jgi:hypothetical protein
MCDIKSGMFVVTPSVVPGGQMLRLGLWCEASSGLMAASWQQLCMPLLASTDDQVASGGWLSQ